VCGCKKNSGYFLPEFFLRNNRELEVRAPGQQVQAENNM
jgi:hypothetical protein